MKQRMSASERKKLLLEIMSEMFEKAQTQQDFTAAKIAKNANISTVRFYKLVRQEFQELRCRLDGPRRPRDEVIGNLRRENGELIAQVRELKKKLEKAAVEELDEAILVIEQLDEENRILRGEIRLLRKRLSEGGGEVIFQVPAESLERSNFMVLNGGKSDELRSEI